MIVNPENGGELFQVPLDYNVFERVIVEVYFSPFLVSVLDVIIFVESYHSTVTLFSSIVKIQTTQHYTARVKLVQVTRLCILLLFI